MAAGRVMTRPVGDLLALKGSARVGLRSTTNERLVEATAERYLGHQSMDGPFAGKRGDGSGVAESYRDSAPILALWDPSISISDLDDIRNRAHDGRVWKR